MAVSQSALERCLKNIMERYGGFMTRMLLALIKKVLIPVIIRTSPYQPGQLAIDTPAQNPEGLVPKAYRDEVYGHYVVRNGWDPEMM